jgi:hypothetical protein
MFVKTDYKCFQRKKKERNLKKGRQKTAQIGNNLQVFVATQQYSHSNAYAEEYRYIVAMIWLSKQCATENGVF